jgi:hypothetical protein
MEKAYYVLEVEARKVKDKEFELLFFNLSTI